MPGGGLTGRKPFVSVRKLEKPRSLPKVQGSALRGTGQTCALVAENSP